MLFYITLFTLCVILLVINNLLINEKYKKLVEIITLAILCIVSGTRYYLGGSDYGIYIKMFNVVPNVFEFDFLNVHNIIGTYGAEVGYLFFNSIIKSIGLNFFGFTLIHSIIFYSCLYIGLKKYTYKFNLLIIVFLYKMFFYNTFISMRQSIAIAIFFVAIKFIEDRKIVKYFGCCLLAFLFHSSALILFPIYFINRIKLTRKMLIILNAIFIPTILLSIFNIPILKPLISIIDLFNSPTLSQKANLYFNATSVDSINIMHTLEYIAIMGLVIFNLNKIRILNKYSETIIKLFVLLLPIFTLFRTYGILTRPKDYFIMTYAVILGYLCRIDNKKYSGLIQLITVIVCFYGFTRFILNFDNGGMMPYSNYLLKGISIFNNF